MKNNIYTEEGVNLISLFISSVKITSKQGMKNTKFLNLEYYYTSYRTIESHCEDIGIPGNNFNII